MATTVRVFSATIPAGTPTDAPVTIPMDMAPTAVDRLQVIVPPGPNGTVGFAITSGGRPIIPANPGAWIITDAEVIDWQLVGQITSGAWELTGYNTGTLPHTVTVRFLTDPIGAPTPAAAPLLPLSALAG